MSTTKADPIIEVDDLHKSFGANEVLKGISTTVRQGEVVAVIGPSGSGKSTFLRCLNLLEAVTSGTVKVEGVDLTDAKTDINQVRQKIGMVFQHFNLFPHKTVTENITLAPVMLGRMNSKQAAERASELLGQVKLSDKADARPAQLSGGQKQRVAIARALASGAKIILADEPTGNLDVANGEKIIELLCNLAHDDNYLVIVVTHDLGITKVVDEVLQMTDGRLTPMSPEGTPVF